MKKYCLTFLSMALALIMAASVFAAEPPKDGNPPDYYVESDGIVTMRSELAQLYDIGIMSDVGGGPFESITRGEMAKIVAQLRGCPDIGEECEFIDVSIRNPYRGSIGFVAFHNYMNGYGDGLFLPDKDITYYEAVKTVVTVLGYEPLALEKGGYPNGYLQVANDLGLILYPGAEDRIASKNDLCEIIHVALDIPFMEQTKYGSVVEYAIMDGNNGTLLKTLRIIREQN